MEATGRILLRSEHLRIQRHSKASVLQLSLLACVYFLRKVAQERTWARNWNNGGNRHGNICQTDQPLSPSPLSSGPVDCDPVRVQNWNPPCIKDSTVQWRIQDFAEGGGPKRLSIFTETLLWGLWWVQKRGEGVARCGKGVICYTI